jgi:3-hydroxybutyryl-CoA dehydratase
MTTSLFFEDLQVGASWKSHGRTITEADVVSFAGLTGDFDPLHVDHEFARQSPFGRPIAHGLLGLSFLAGLSSTCPAVHTAAFVAIRSWEFKGPLFPGDTVHVSTEVLEAEQTSKRRGRVVWRRQLVNQQGEVVQDGILETLVSTARSRSTGRQPSPTLRIGDEVRRSA